VVGCKNPHPKVSNNFQIQHSMKYLAIIFETVGSTSLNLELDVLNYLEEFSNTD